MKPTPWAPLLSGELAERSSGAVDDLVAALATLEPPNDSPMFHVDGAIADAALFTGYAARALDRDDLGDVCGAQLDAAVDAIADGSSPPSLFGGFVGIAWTVEHLEVAVFGVRGPDDEDPNEAIDDAVAQYLDQPRWNDPYDLIIGLVGLGVYALERHPRGRARAIVSAILDHLDRLAERTAEGVTWKSAPEELPEHERHIAPDGYYNLGLAHGVPGVVAFLAQAIAAGCADERAAALLDGAAAWTAAQAADYGTSRYAPWVGPATTPVASRAGWCYGDASVAASLVLAGAVRERGDWTDLGVELARGAAALSLEDARVRDCGLCHGAAGLGHMFHRMHHLTGDAALREAAVEWYRRALDLRDPDHGIAGFPMALNKPGGVEYLSDPSLLAGASGVGLALLAAISDIEPAWDRRLLLSLPAAP